LEQFRQEIYNYEFFLFLDNDAFPIKKNWLGLLRQALPESKEIAAPIRAENLENRLHVSVIFARQCGIENLKFTRRSSRELMGTMEKDVHISYNFEKREQAFPLLRSNKVNIHPFFCAVYFDIFYHHGCGSRPSRFRSKAFWDKMCGATTTKGELQVKLRHELFRNPCEFVEKLAGWSTRQYASFNRPLWL
jgi:hypothetical protein